MFNPLNWIRGPAGPPGETGWVGEQGSGGYRGEAGERGPKGADGTQGSQGPQGARGLPGEGWALLISRIPVETVEAGDTIVITSPDRLSEAVIARITRVFGERFKDVSDVKVLVLENGQDIVVTRAER